MANRFTAVPGPTREPGSLVAAPGSSCRCSGSAPRFVVSLLRFCPPVRGFVAPVLPRGSHLAATAPVFNWRPQGMPVAALSAKNKKGQCALDLATSDKMRSILGRAAKDD